MSTGDNGHRVVGPQRSDIDGLHLQPHMAVQPRVLGDRIKVSADGRPTTKQQTILGESRRAARIKELSHRSPVARVVSCRIGAYRTLDVPRDNCTSGALGTT